MFDPKSLKTPVAVWWIIWFAILSSVVAIYTLLGQAIPPPDTATTVQALRYLPVLLVMLSAIIRWLLLPRFTQAIKALPIFIVGLSLAEGSGIIGLFLVPELKETYFVLSLIGVFQYVPLFAKNLKP
jgi:hypothetical protein